MVKSDPAMSSSMAAAVLRRGGKRLLAAPLISASRSVDAVSGPSSSHLVKRLFTDLEE